MAKKLIINADDFGLDDGINRGIIACFKKGIVKSISILPCGNAYHNAVYLAQKAGIFKLGVHLAATGALYPASPAGDVLSLLEKNGKFYKNYRGFLSRYFLGKIDLDEIYAEFKSQIGRVREDGFEISHLDSHQHIHAVPGILRFLVKIAEEEGIDYIRFPLEEKLSMANPLDLRNRIRRSSLLFICKLSRDILYDSAVKHNDHFFGHFHSGALNRKILSNIMSNLEDGLTEIACHPGYLTYDVRKDHGRHRHCEVELEALCDPAFMDEIRRNGIELVGH